MATNVSMLFSPKISKLYMKDSGGTMREIAILYKGTTVAWKDGSVVSAAGMDLLGDTTNAPLNDSRIRGRVIVKSDDDYAALATKDTNIFYAVYDTSVVITLNLNGGTSTQTSLKKKKGSTLWASELTAPTRPGHIFFGWTTTKDDSSANYFSSTTVNGAVTLYAYWVNANPVSGTGVSPTWTNEPYGNRKICTYKIPITGSPHGVFGIELHTDNGLYTETHGAYEIWSEPDTTVSERLYLEEPGYPDPQTGLYTVQSIWGYTATLTGNGDSKTFTFSTAAYSGETLFVIDTSESTSHILYFSGANSTGTVYWGDGTSETIKNGSSARKESVHVYPSLNTQYVVKIIGNWSSVGPGYSSLYNNKARVRHVLAYGQTRLVAYAFANQHYIERFFASKNITLGTNLFRYSSIDQIGMNGVVKISDSCFRDVDFGNSQIPVLYFNSVTSTGTYVFSSASLLGYVVFNAKLTAIGDYMFTNTTSVADGTTFLFRGNTKAQITGLPNYPFKSTGNMVTSIDSTGAQWTF